MQERGEPVSECGGRGCVTIVMGLGTATATATAPQRTHPYTHTHTYDVDVRTTVRYAGTAVHGEVDELYE